MDYLKHPILPLSETINLTYAGVMPRKWNPRPRMAGSQGPVCSLMGELLLVVPSHKWHAVPPLPQSATKWEFAAMANLGRSQECSWRSAAAGGSAFEPGPMPPSRAESHTQS